MKKFLIIILVFLFSMPARHLYAQQPDSVKIAKAQQNIADNKKDGDRIQRKIDKKQRKIKKQQEAIERKERRMNKKQRDTRKEAKKIDQD